MYSLQVVIYVLLLIVLLKDVERTHPSMNKCTICYIVGFDRTGSNVLLASISASSEGEK